MPLCCVRSIYRWYESFERGRTSAALQGGSGTPSRSIHEVNINTAAAVIQEEPALTIRQVPKILDVSYGSAETMLMKELGFSRVYARWVPRLLIQKMKDQHVCVCKLWHDNLAKDETWFDNVITRNEAWMYHHEPAMKQATSCWFKKGSEPPLKQIASKSTQKCMAITFFDHKGVIFTKWVPQGQTVNKEYMIKLFKQLK